MRWPRTHALAQGGMCWRQSASKNWRPVLSFVDGCFLTVISLGPHFQGSKFKEKTEWNHSKDASEGLLGRRNLTFNIEDIPSDIWSESRICPLRPKGIRAACEQECGFCWPPHSQPLCCYFRNFILSKIVTTLRIVNNLNFRVCCAGHAGGAVDASDGAVKLRRWGDKRLGVQLMTSFIYTMNQYNIYILYTKIYIYILELNTYIL